MISFLIALVIIVGAGGTVMASDSARPGDALFPLDRAIENIRISLSSEENKAELKIKFAEERLDELESILEDEDSKDDSGDVSDEAKDNLSHALDILTLHLSEIHGVASTTPGIAKAISVIEERLQNRANDLPEELKIKIHDDRGRIELKSEEGKIKVKIGDDGEIEVEIEEDEDDKSGSSSNATSNKSDDDDDNDKDEDKDDDSDLSDNSEFEAEADVFTDITVVKVEIQGKKSTFTTDAKTRASVITQIVLRYPTLTVAEVDTNLDFEVENRASNSDDSADDEDDDDDKSGSSQSEDDSDDDSEEDEDDDNSGSSDGN